MADLPVPEPFSDRLATWLKSDDRKTVGQLGEVFGEKSFAVTVLLLVLLLRECVGGCWGRAGGGGVDGRAVQL